MGLQFDAAHEEEDSLKRKFKQKTRQAEISENIASKNQQEIVMVEASGQVFGQQKLKSYSAEKDSHIAVKLENIKSL